MAYGFNDDKSKSAVYTKTETYTKNEIEALLDDRLDDYYTTSETYNKSEVYSKGEACSKAYAEANDFGSVVNIKSLATISGKRITLEGYTFPSDGYLHVKISDGSRFDYLELTMKGASSLNGIALLESRTSSTAAGCDHTVFVRKGMKLALSGSAGDAAYITAMALTFTPLV